MTPMTLWRRLVGHRVRERAFWTIQAMVAAATAVHGVVEAFDLFTGELGLALGVHHLPVLLYLIPVVYAGVRYGFEGAALTGAWCVVLSLPNIFLWHAESYLWVGDLLYVSAVVAIGLVVAVPVERDRRHQQRLAAATRRLELLNDVAFMLVSVPIRQALPRLLGVVRETLDLEGVAVVSSMPPGEPLAVDASAGLTDDAELRLAATAVRGGLVPGCTVVRSGLVATPLGEGQGEAALLAWTRGPGLDREDCGLLAAVASQVGLAMENRRLERREEERLRSYVHAVTAAQEEERGRIALELHDTTAQELVRLCRGLDSLEGAAGQRAADLAEGLRELAGHTLEGVRRLSRDLRPTILDDLGLVPALEWLATDLSHRGIASRCRVSGALRRLDADAELALFRIAQEALRNVEKHAGAAHVSIGVRFDRDRVRIAVSDDGRGLGDPGPPEELLRSGRLGLAGMHERADLIGGRLRLTTRPGGGTTVAVEVGTGTTPHAEPRLREPVAAEAEAGSSV